MFRFNRKRFPLIFLFITFQSIDFLGESGLVIPAVYHLSYNGRESISDIKDKIFRIKYRNGANFPHEAQRFFLIDQ